MKQYEIVEKYAKLMHSVKTSDFYKIDLTNRVNCYRCEACNHVTKTRDVDPGVTPFMFSCEVCGSMAHSTFYNDVVPYKAPTFEWYRPSMAETCERKDDPSFDLEHVLQGGLISRKL